MPPPSAEKLLHLRGLLLVVKYSSVREGGERRGMAELRPSPGFGNGAAAPTNHSRSQGPGVMAAPKSWGGGAGRSGEKVHKRGPPRRVGVGVLGVRHQRVGSEHNHHGGPFEGHDRAGTGRKAGRGTV